MTILAGKADYTGTYFTSQCILLAISSLQTLTESNVFLYWEQETHVFLFKVTVYRLSITEEVSERLYALMIVDDQKLKGLRFDKDLSSQPPAVCKPVPRVSSIEHISLEVVGMTTKAELQQRKLVQ